MILFWIWLGGYALLCLIAYFLLWLITPSEFEAAWGEIDDVGGLAVWLSTVVIWALFWPVLLLVGIGLLVRYAATRSR